MDWVTGVIGIFVICAALWGDPARAQAFPIRPITVVVPYAPGGLTDLLARMTGKELSERIKQPVVVENRAGGGSVIGTEQVAKASPDGYTLLLVATDLAINPSLRGRLPYDSIRDFAPITLLARSNPVLVVNSSFPANSLQDLIAFAKSRPGSISYGSGGNGTVTHLAMELLKNMAGIEMVHVPYQGLGPAVKDLLGGQIPLMFVQPPLVRAYVQSGKLRILATPGHRRSPQFPEVPTVAEAAGLPGYALDAWFGLVAPVGTPAGVLTYLSNELRVVLQLQQVRERFAPTGTELISSLSPEEFSAFIRAEIEKWARIVKISGARID